MSVINKLVDKITSGPQAQYILGGALVVIIALSLVSVFWSSFRGPNNNVPPELHAYCLETDQEFVVDPSKMGPEGGPNPGMMMPNPGMGGMGGLILSPFTNKYTAVMMTHCPSCDKWFVPEYLKDALERKDQSPMMMMPPAEMQKSMICPLCKTDIVQWYKDHRSKK